MATTTKTRMRRLNARETALPADLVPSGTRGTILDAALRLFAEQGFAAASIRDIAAVAGVQSATLYTHYPSKEHVLAELVDVAHREHLRRVRAALLDSIPDPRQQLRAFVRAHVRTHADYPMLTLIANAELHALSPELGASSFALREQSEDVLTQVIRRGIDRGMFDPPHAWLAAAAIGGMGIRVANFYTPEFELDADEVARIYADFACRIVGTTGRVEPQEGGIRHDATTASDTSEAVEPDG